MIKVRRFKALENKNNKTYYVVTGTDSFTEAIQAVIKVKKANTKSMCDYLAIEGVIADYVNEDGEAMDGAYIWGDARGEGCMIVWHK